MLTSLVSICSGLKPFCTARFAIAKVPAHGSTHLVYPDFAAVSIRGTRNFCSDGPKHPKNIAPGSIKNAIAFFSFLSVFLKLYYTVFTGSYEPSNKPEVNYIVETDFSHTP